MTLAAISRSVGYSSPFSFSTAFKQHYGVSPQKYRSRSWICRFRPMPGS
ncbi:helix-turn-helix domain-containing protein [Haloactinomyces albus]|uniref:AraC-like DNA-binding protein n=1 Tax=Haloactinomyces albus TaxID=1352928 RepID=A0AAE3ZJ67_9ACTN|nr:AraC-like DNA-binding protein [Haloactinomyces albus]